MSARRAHSRRPGAVDVIVVGAGHCGLAMSRYLSEHGIEHVVLERGEVANSWRHERWDSLRLLTPNWLSRLPHYAYAGPDPDGYMTMPEVIEFIASYATLIDAPIRTDTTVTSVQAVDGGYRVATSRASWTCRSLVLANGAHGVPVLPACAERLPASVQTVTAKDYRNPSELGAGNVLVVGASATGMQLADEISRSGRGVMLAVGEHIRLPRLYRGRDIQWWLKATGVLDQRYQEVDDLVRARRVPSPQLVGSPSRSTLDLNALQERGVELVGRLVGVDAERALFSGSLASHCAMADLKANRLLERIDSFIHEQGEPCTEPALRLAPTRVPESPKLRARLGEGGIATIVWATGFKPDYSWLHLPVLTSSGHLQHDGGIVSAPGVYALGLNFMRRRKSSFMHGAEDDVKDIGAHLTRHLNTSARTRQRSFARESDQRLAS